MLPDEKAKEKIQGGKLYCTGLLTKYSQSLSTLQIQTSKLHNDLNESENRLCSPIFIYRYTILLKQHKPYMYIQKAYEFWVTKMMPFLRAVNTELPVKDLFYLPKQIAAYMLISGQYGKAVVCLFHATELNPNDISSRLLLVQWLCNIGLFNLARSLLEKEDITSLRDDSFKKVFEVISEFVELHIGENKERPIRRLLELLNFFDEKSKTFNSYQGQAIIKKGLFFASALPNVDVAEISDPLKNLDDEFSRLRTLVKNRYRTFFTKDASINLMEKVDDLDEFLKLCSNIAEFFDSGASVCRGLFEAGLLREFEQNVLILSYQALRFAEFPRILSVMNLLMMSTMVAKNMFAKSDDARLLLNSLILLDRQETERSQKDGETKAVDISDSIKHNDEFLCMYENDGTIRKIMEKNSHLTIDVYYARFLLSSFSSVSFRNLAFRFHETQQIVSEEMEEMSKSCGIKSSTEEAAYLSISDVFLSAVARWLIVKGHQEKMDIRNSVIQKALELCETSCLYHRRNWLLIRQIPRQWLANNINTPWIKKSGSQKLMDEFIDQLSNLSTGAKAESSYRTPSKRRPQSLPREKSTQPCEILSDDIDGLLSYACEAERDFKSFSHLFYREWRFLICSFLATASFLKKFDSFVTAYYCIEASFIATRQSANRHAGEVFYYKFVKEFMETVKLLPKDLTYVHLFLDSNRILWLIRLHCDRSPLVLPLERIPQDDILLDLREKILKENQETSNMGRSCSDAKAFWAARRGVEAKIEKFLEKVQDKWVKEFSALFKPCLSMFSSEDIDIIIRNGFSEDIAKTLIDCSRYASEWDWFKIAHNLAYLYAPHLDDSAIDELYKHFYGTTKERELDLARNIECGFSLLSISPIPKCLDGRNSFYILDPGGDLVDTQKRLVGTLKGYDSWKGIIGEQPKSEELKDHLSNRDFFFYVGHGSGTKYFSRSAVRVTDCKAVSVLMGCSSVKTLPEGDGFDGRNVVYDYCIAGCPCTIGCLWEVTDGEIDRFFIAFLKYCFAVKSNSDDSEWARKSPKLLIDAIAHARSVCKLKYLTGGAVVAYGLPIATFV